MPVRLVAIVTLLLTTLPASAAFLERHEHWTVAAASQTACAAFNRPLEEFNAAPYIALSIRQRRGQPARLQVFAWPGVFNRGQTVTVAITSDSGWTELEAEAIDTYFVEGKDALPAKLLDQRREARTPAARFEITSLPQMLVFDLSQLEAVMKSLEACMRQLPPG